MFNPNSPFAQSHEVRVTMRGVRLSEHGSPVQVSTRSDFIAPDIAPVRLIDSELAKGLRGWTDYDVKPEDRRQAGIRVFETRRAQLIKARAQAIVDDATCGETVIRKAPTADKRVVSRTGPRPGRGRK